jgi:hypothetical protein
MLLSLPQARAVAAAVIVTLGPAAAAIADTTQDQAARDATLAAKEVLLKLDTRNGSTTGGTVKLQKIGSTRTRIRVQLANPTGHPLSLAVVRGSDCVDNRESALGAAIPLNPVNSSQMSETIVSVPMSALTSRDYLVQVRDATAREQITQACARLAR